MSHYSQVKHKLIDTYSQRCLQKLSDTTRTKGPIVQARLSPKDRRFVSQLIGLVSQVEHYRNPVHLDKALDAVDLAKIYEGVDKREQQKPQAPDSSLQYEDLVVLELLHYFKNHFFKWITKPECPRCTKDGDNIVPQGVTGPPSQNPDGISRVEKYRCRTCSVAIEFPRYNSAVKLLETRQGRCGEWVNCFMLISQAVLGPEAQMRYVWNNEDHVWCEYYSSGLKRWVHLDPCEAAFDEPSLYTDNWGKAMSWVVGVNHSYMVDLSHKYITNSNKTIDKSRVVDNVWAVESTIRLMAFQMLLKYYQLNIEPLSVSKAEKLSLFYYKCLVVYGSELNKSPTSTKSAVTRTATTGRQTGGPEWTTARGESG
ncbi:peptide-N4-(N-acetyl-beta- glucosaminyl)asparagine amidase [Yamadazyma tenuis]|uniref:Peptide:N-glycanase 1 n=1 Tax=Candida tenuis (strain ATCC 10573 / BCRC 21748 / CBS 615 / JCM 9827 / NBRC 10315 / NRRL Y-1498 / VKM Y-70) TaxID=590646 RepID=G3BBV0_CANTC|nr:uncharacterized protein CANTEDRAFT_116106 [Yamadazyma tenuis ATCC 10573]XP_006690220.1 uncharacterized protein CANTEDRAFT_116106 [Yamadazyma tenuis ATCC 10573]EGV61005.1 hypothetical protein CANTEDRAFT_116106 [Yamadazyma tenuis ATCC 10573]EGV61006.1 hypothetical protein CANTEDRAFT_116106 [Yamadazyma tenuis ATCC 10573]WEJ94681.1 peptide-N4-(N-acetyl-beta- glucosaminyl)asparagine amidase [Yamadazyma tenuis]